MRPTRIISGGQTGADRGALDAAIALGIEHGGYCPRGRRAEDGVIPAQYKLVSTSVSSYPHRTKLNVAESDATLVFVMGAETPGSLLAMSHAVALDKPCLLVNVREPRLGTIVQIREWLHEHQPRVLHVAGSRESRAPGLQALVCEVIVAVFTL
jgi:hypothetical protein